MEIQKFKSEGSVTPLSSCFVLRYEERRHVGQSGLGNHTKKAATYQENQPDICSITNKTWENLPGQRGWTQRHGRDISEHRIHHTLDCPHPQCLKLER